jgi:hypothetical protein
MATSITDRKKIIDVDAHLTEPAGVSDDASLEKVASRQSLRR